MSVISRIDDFAHRFLCGYKGQPSEFARLDYGQMMYWYHIMVANDEAERKEMKKARQQSKK